VHHPKDNSLPDDWLALSTLRVVYGRKQNPKRRMGLTRVFADNRFTTKFYMTKKQKE